MFHQVRIHRKIWEKAISFAKRVALTGNESSVHRSRIADLMSRQTSLAVRPALTAFRIAMIWCSLNLLFRIEVLPSVIVARKPLVSMAAF